MNGYIRRSVTLIEIIIVMILIATITGTLAVSYRGSLEKGYAFKTDQAMHKIEAIMHIYFAEHPEEMANANSVDWKKVILNSPLVRPGDTSILYDGWGTAFDVKPEVDTEHGGVNVTVSSKAYQSYKAKGKK